VNHDIKVEPGTSGPGATLQHVELSGCRLSGGLGSARGENAAVMMGVASGIGEGLAQRPNRVTSAGRVDGDDQYVDAVDADIVWLPRWPFGTAEEAGNAIVELGRVDRIYPAQSTGFCADDQVGVTLGIAGGEQRITVGETEDVTRQLALPSLDREVGLALPLDPLGLGLLRTSIANRLDQGTACRRALDPASGVD
jgi:hypothetical protein